MAKKAATYPQADHQDNEEVDDNDRDVGCICNCEVRGGRLLLGQHRGSRWGGHPGSFRASRSGLICFFLYLPAKLPS